MVSGTAISILYMIPLFCSNRADYIAEPRCVVHLIDLRRHIALNIYRKSTLLLLCMLTTSMHSTAEEPWYNACFQTGERGVLHENLSWHPPIHKLDSLKAGVVANLPSINTGERYVVHGILDRWLIFVAVISQNGEIHDGSGILIIQPAKDLKVGDEINGMLLYCYLGMRRYYGSGADEVVNVKPHLRDREFPCFELILQRRSKEFSEFVIEQKTVERKWHDTTGRYAIDAELVDCNDSSIKLSRKDGKIIEVNLAKLCDADRDYVSEFVALRESIKSIIPRQFNAFLDETSFDQTYVAKSLKAMVRYSLDRVDGRLGHTLTTEQLDSYSLFKITVGTEVEIVRIHWLSDVGEFFELRAIDEDHGRFYTSELALYFDVQQNGPPRLRGRGGN